MYSETSEEMRTNQAVRNTNPASGSPRTLAGMWLSMSPLTLWFLPPKDYYYLSVKALYTVGYSTSLVSLTTAMVILCRFRKLHCTRNFIHMNLFVSFILRAISVFIKDGVLYAEQDGNHCFISTVECKAVMVFFHYCVMSNYFWLFIEGLYLFTLLVETFFPERRYFYWYTIIGWGTPTICVTVWAVLRLHFDDTGCWDMNDNTALWWVIKGPVVGSIMINFVLFIGIIVILVQKLQSPDIGGNESSIYLRLARSTLLLIPLFGIHYTVFAFSPENVSKRERLVFELGLGSFQGFVVAVLYCFLNGEVQNFALVLLNFALFLPAHSPSLFNSLQETACACHHQFGAASQIAGGAFSPVTEMAMKMVGAWHRLPEKLWLSLDPWKCPRPGWTGLGATWIVEGVPAYGRGWKEMSFMISSNPNRSVLDVEHCGVQYQYLEDTIRDKVPG
ncbi:hypothetical protein DUI87_17850 [Hirundo rustica rustica]|uniref:G-protein coupled receptors family 2 profile 2 domain-containing protein n=1 Tax=Hirundo rustica rustica TaxID=333673 RepID=A0A3M0K0F3_HIRRU|nr:hypothetical protein DUI87_17850 [Hirundo rustica rustica]